MWRSTYDEQVEAGVYVVKRLADAGVLDIADTLGRLKELKDDLNTSKRVTAMVQVKWIAEKQTRESLTVALEGLQIKDAPESEKPCWCFDPKWAVIGDVITHSPECKIAKRAYSQAKAREFIEGNGPTK
ncbi:MAG: hypothetical protein Q8P23_01955 [bacterium]|nr:hypothetical protein [bacterium]